MRWIELFQDVQADHLPAKPLEERVRQENSKYVYQVLKMLWYFDPDEYYIENPWDSAMKDLEWMDVHCVFMTEYVAS